MQLPILTIVVPCFNEEEVLQDTMSQLDRLLSDLISTHAISDKSKILLVDDGSKDQTWKLIYQETLKNGHIKGLKLSRNVGHQNALLAGLLTAKQASDCVISIDADLQDDISVIPQFIEKFNLGFDIVYGVRKGRQTDTLFKRSTAQSFYKLMNTMGVKLIYNHADFRLMSKRALDALEDFREVNLFLRGMIPLIGFSSTSVPYDRKERIAGESKYPLKKMLAFAFDGITSFSVTPIRLVLMLGCAAFFTSLLFGLYFIFLKFFGDTELGWTSLITSVWLIGGLQLIAIGLIGEYVGKIYKESKQRPKFIIDIDTFNLPFPRYLMNTERSEHESYRLENRDIAETN